MIASLLLATVAASTVSFSNGTSAKFDSQSPVVRFERRGKVVGQIDLSAYMRDRINNPKSGDSSSTDLKRELGRGKVVPYLLQLAPNSKTSAFGIVGFRRAYLSIPNDMIHDLVAVDVGSVPKIGWIRSLEAPVDFDASPTFPRLFWSKGELVLRTRYGFESVDAYGELKLVVDTPYAMTMLGKSRLNELVLGNKERENPCIQFLNLSTRAIKTVEIDVPEGPLTYLGFAPGRTSNKVVIFVDVNVGNSGKQTFSYSVDFDTKRVTGPNTEPSDDSSRRSF